MEDPRLEFPATTRNRDAILDFLRAHWPPAGFALEIASGSGEHVTWFARHMPGWRFQPSDHETPHLDSIRAWTAHGALTNVLPPLTIDASAPVWPADAFAPFDAIFCANMIHIAPWAAAEGLFAGAGRLLRAGGLLTLYGPFMQGGRHNAPSNAAFDESLRARDPAWGVRDIDDLQRLAARSGLTLERIAPLPANNHCLVFVRA